MTEPDRVFVLHRGQGPLIATAVHEGSEVRRALEPHMALAADDRRREEDPATGDWTHVAPTRVIGSHSRFQVDLNRPRQAAVYRAPEDCWGLQLYKTSPPEDELARSLKGYDDFYAEMDLLLQDVIRAEGRFVVFDIHSYNHRRSGPAGDPADPLQNPQVNVGTGSVDRSLWHPVVDTFIDTLRAFPYPEGPLDVRENVKFQGGNWSQWVNARYGHCGTAIAIEVKKFYMDEWSGIGDDAAIKSVTEALRSTVEPVLGALQSITLPHPAT